MTFVGFKSSMFDKNSFLANPDPEPFFNENNQLQQNMAAPVWLHNANYIVKLLLSKKLCVLCTAVSLKLRNQEQKPPELN